MAKKLTWRELETLAICIFAQILQTIIWGKEPFNQDEQKYGTMTKKEKREWHENIFGEADRKLYKEMYERGVIREIPDWAKEKNK
jgi:hypothetical protein